MIVWKEIAADKRYEISNTGLVRRASTKHLMYLEDNTAGYYRVRLGNPQKKYFVHRLVAEAFVDGYFKDAVVNHKDFNKHNNTVNNLEWVTLSDNSKHTCKHGRMTGAFKTQYHNILYKNKLYKNTTVKDMCTVCGFGKTTFYNYLKSGKISYVSNDYCESK